MKKLTYEYDKDYKFPSYKKRDEFFDSWSKQQKKPLKYGCAGEYLGDKETLGMAGKTISIIKR